MDVKALAASAAAYVAGDPIGFMLSVSGFCAWVAAFTKSKEDDKFWGKTRAVINVLGGNVFNAKNRTPWGVSFKK